MLLKIKNLTHFDKDYFIRYLHNEAENIVLDNVKHIQFDNSKGFNIIPKSEINTECKREMMEDLKQRYGSLLNIYDLNSNGNTRAIYSIVYSLTDNSITIHNNPLNINHNASVLDLSCFAMRYLDNYLSNLNNSSIINLNDICDEIAADIGWTFEVDIDIAIIKFPISVNIFATFNFEVNI